MMRAYATPPPSQRRGVSFGDAASASTFRGTDCILQERPVNSSRIVAVVRACACVWPGPARAVLLACEQPFREFVYLARDARQLLAVGSSASTASSLRRGLFPLAAT
ncbi:hypothetical protein MRX96_030820 [Rhipicephalus microplus]